jgi:hypothetical protein
MGKIATKHYVVSYGITIYPRKLGRIYFIAQLLESVLLFGGEMCPLTETRRSKIRAAELGYLRKVTVFKSGRNQYYKLHSKQDLRFLRL